MCDSFVRVRSCSNGLITDALVEVNNTGFNPISTKLVGQKVNIVDNISGLQVTCGYVVDVGTDCQFLETDEYGNPIVYIATPTTGYSETTVSLCTTTGQHSEEWYTWEWNPDDQIVQVLSTDETFINFFPASKFGDCDDLLTYIRIIRDNNLLNRYYVQNINPIADGIKSLVQIKENCNKSITFLVGDVFVQFVENNDGTLSIYQYDQQGYGNQLKYDCCNADLINALTNNTPYSFPNGLSGIGDGLFDWWNRIIDETGMDSTYKFFPYYIPSTEMSPVWCDQCRLTPTECSNPLEEITTGNCGQLDCPPGSTLIDGKCRTENVEDAILNGTIYTAGNGDQNPNYGKFGARFYPDVDPYVFPLSTIGNISTSTAELYDNNGTGTLLPYTADSVTNIWKSRLNIAGIWAAGTSNGNPTGEWIGFSRCVDVTATRTYCIGMAADNRMRFKLNGQIIAKFDANATTYNFNYWHVVEITLNAGANIIEMEGYNDNSYAAFGAEIYDTDIVTLQTLTTTGELEPYILWSTRDRIGETFDIGEVSGYTCPDGTSYDSCIGGRCVSVTYDDPSSVECCYRIENCEDDLETYLVKFASTETNPLYLNSVFKLEGNITLFKNKCFILRGIEVCQAADVENVTVVEDFGDMNCEACNPIQKTIAHKFVSCDTGEEIYISITQELVVDNIYDFEDLDFPGCYKYAGIDNTFTPTKTEVPIKTDYGTDNCKICEPCYLIEDCLTGDQYTIRFNGDVNPSDKTLPGYEDKGSMYTAYFDPDDLIGFIIRPYGNPQIDDKCFKLIEKTTCNGEADYENMQAQPVKVFGDPFTNTSDCIDCCPRYLLTDCANPSNQVEIVWECGQPPLDENLVYRFNEGVDPNVCWTVELVPFITYYYNRA